MIVRFACVVGLCANGCQSGKFSYYLSPQVAGQVLAADTRQPLAGVAVRRVVPVPTSGEATPPKGGQLLTEPAGVRTDANGRFVLDAERDLAVLFHHGRWQSVTVSFERTGYASFQTNFTTVNIKGRPSGDMPRVNAGDILLTPISR